MNIELKIRFGGQYPVRHDAENCAQQSHAESDSESAAEKGENQAFGKKLSEDLSASCSHGTANRNFSSAAPRPSPVADLQC